MNCIINRRAKFSASHRYWLPELNDAENVERLKNIMKLGDPTDSYQNLFKEVKLSQCKIDGREYYKMLCIPKNRNGASLSIYVGKNSYLIRRIEISAPINYTSQIERYSLYEGVIIPEKTLITQNGETSSSIINYKTGSFNTEGKTYRRISDVFCCLVKPS